MGGIKLNTKKWKEPFPVEPVYLLSSKPQPSGGVDGSSAVLKMPGSFGLVLDWLHFDLWGKVREVRQLFKVRVATSNAFRVRSIGIRAMLCLVSIPHLDLLLPPQVTFPHLDPSSSRRGVIGRSHVASPREPGSN